MKTLRASVVIHFLLAAALTSCGQDVCVMGMGSCSNYEQQAGQNSSGNPTVLSHNGLTISAQPTVGTTFGVNNFINLSASGGNTGGAIATTYRFWYSWDGNSWTQIYPPNGATTTVTYTPTQTGNLWVKVTDPTMQATDDCTSCKLMLPIQ
jgi:hypothetical protein